MKNLSRLIVFLLLLVVAFATMSSVALGASRLVYSDEFNGPLDTASWTNDTPWNTHYTTGELEYYDPANCTFANGMMTLKSEKRATHGYSYASGIVTSLPHAKFSYGYFEIRAKLPKGQGIWPAFWLTNDSTLEIDGLEMLGDRPSRIYMTLHENGNQIQGLSKDGPDYSAGFHTYGIDWQSSYVKWYIDGELCATYNKPVPSDSMWICLNTAVGGAWPGSPDATTQFPVNFDIDYVRVYDKKPVVNTAPVANADSYSTPNATALRVAAPGLLGNDSDAQNDALSASVLTQPAHGSVTVAADGSFTYTPSVGFAGTDSFTYRVYDGATYSAGAAVSIAVAPPVVAQADAYSTDIGTTLTVPAAGVLANDSDARGRGLSATVLTQPTHGTLAFSSDGSFVYVPVAGYAGTDAFTYRASDGTDSGEAAVSLVVVDPTAVPTVITKPVVTPKNRTHKTYRVAGSVHLGSVGQVLQAAFSAAALTPAPVVAKVQVQRLVHGTWHGYKTTQIANPATHFKKVVGLRTGTFRVRTQVTGGYAPAATSAWSRSVRVR